MGMHSFLTYNKCNVNKTIAFCILTSDLVEMLLYCRCSAFCLCFSARFAGQNRVLSPSCDSMMSHGNEHWKWWDIPLNDKIVRILAFDKEVAILLSFSYLPFFCFGVIGLSDFVFCVLSFFVFHFFFLDLFFWKYNYFFEAESGLLLW